VIVPLSAHLPSPIFVQLPLITADFTYNASKPECEDWFSKVDPGGGDGATNDEESSVIPASGVWPRISNEYVGMLCTRSITKHPLQGAIKIAVAST
jgi:hypothetical protein